MNSHTHSNGQKFPEFSVELVTSLLGDTGYSAVAISQITPVNQRMLQCDNTEILDYWYTIMICNI